MGKRKKIKGDAVAELAPVVLEQLGAKLRHIGIVKAGEFAKDKFIRDAGVDRGHYHDVKKAMGFFKMLRSRPDLFHLFDVVGMPDNVEHLWLRAPGSKAVQGRGSKPCPAFIAVCYCNRGNRCSDRHDPADWCAQHGFQTARRAAAGAAPAGNAAAAAAAAHDEEEYDEPQIIGGHPLSARQLSRCERAHAAAVASGSLKNVPVKQLAKEMGAPTAAVLACLKELRARDRDLGDSGRGGGGGRDESPDRLPDPADPAHLAGTTYTKEEFQNLYQGSWRDKWESAKESEARAVVGGVGSAGGGSAHRKRGRWSKEQKRERRSKELEARAVVEGVGSAGGGSAQQQGRPAGGRGRWLGGAEKRMDAADGGWYTRAEFTGLYGGDAEWDAAAPRAAPVGRGRASVIT